MPSRILCAAAAVLTLSACSGPSTTDKSLSVLDGTGKLGSFTSC